MSNLLGIVRLTLVGGRNIRSDQEQVDPFAVVTYSGQQLQTDVVTDNPNPVWNQEFFLHATVGAAQHIAITCINSITDEPLGEARIALPKTWKDKYSDDSWFSLSGSKSSAAVHVKLVYREIRSFVSELVSFKTSRDELEEKLNAEVAKNSALEEEKRKLQLEILHYSGNRAPAWIPDDDIDNCMRCNSKFGMFRRKHHCRYCAKIFCDTCCNEETPIPQYNFTDPVRVCVACFRSCEHRPGLNRCKQTRHNSYIMVDAQHTGSKDTQR